MITRDIVQQQSVDLINNYNNVILKWGTGTGKSLAFIKIQKDLKPKKVYIIVAEVAHIKNWQDEYKKHNAIDLLNNVEIFCYASLKKYINTEVDMICFDEGHHLITDKRLEYISTIKSTKYVLLSATFKKRQREILEANLGIFKEHSITLKQSIENNILPEPTIYLIPLQFANQEYTTIELFRGLKAKRKIVNCSYENRWQFLKDKHNYPNLHLIMKCTLKQRNEHLDSTIEYYKRKYFTTQQIAFKNKWLLLGSERKRFLAEIKTNIVKQLLKQINNKRFICFTGSIEQANILSNNTNVIHSKVKDSQDIIESFNQQLISHLFVVDMLKEGQNLNNIEVGVIVQLDGDTGPFIQKAGRVMRAENPIIFIFYYKNTRDEEYLNNILTEIDKEHIKIIDNINTFKL